MSKTRHFIALMCVLIMVLAAYALGAVLSARALGEAPTVEPETGWLVVQTLPTGALRCWESRSKFYYPCSENHLLWEGRMIFFSESAVLSCTEVGAGDWSAAYEALRVSPSDCGQSRPALAGAP